jgi:hypothetical protein
MSTDSLVDLAPFDPRLPEMACEEAFGSRLAWIVQSPDYFEMQTIGRRREDDEYETASPLRRPFRRTAVR